MMLPVPSLRLAVRHPEPFLSGADTALRAAFSAGGALSAVISDWRPRPQQQDMAAAVSEAVKGARVLVAEAGTGTGKTLAYLVPAMMEGGKVIVSTASKTLQDQLFFRDIPAVRQALTLPRSIALLKGRANYVCRHHLERASVDARFLSREDAGHLVRIAEFARSAERGDRAELPDVPENAPAWTFATSTRDNCLGSECAHFGECFVMRARRNALAADLVVVNHHLFFADVWLKDEGVAELLPACNTVILDEAHQLPETARMFFGETFTTGSLLELARDSRATGAVYAGDFPELQKAAAALDKSVRELRLATGDQPSRLPQDVVLRMDAFRARAQTLSSALATLGICLESQAERAPELDNCLKRCETHAGKLARWLEGEAEGSVRWLDVTGYGLAFNATPLDISPLFRKQIEGQARAWVLTSATLAVNGDFSHYRQEMGLDGATTACWDSPYDFARQALLYVPPDMPNPNEAHYTDAVVRAALPLVRASEGRAFLLFTSLRALRRAQELLEAAELPWPLLVQGERPKNDLLQSFRMHGNAVLLGSNSFWEGVDVRGEALSLVVIDRLPFSPPDDPVEAARIRHIRGQGGNPFLDYQLPRAAIALKQGAGRLIRDEADRGVLMICDPRLIGKGYGRQLLAALPPMARTRDLQEARQFFA
jgi:ATP-dependent DNA helicase DinG